tara:strand:+ start:334 stop:573 length:240 start_codon:yes stop_codon:yes gene_type:complete
MALTKIRNSNFEDSFTEMYGFILEDDDEDGIKETLKILSTNGGADVITSADYNNCDEMIWASVGFVWEIEETGRLTVTT